MAKCCAPPACQPPAGPDPPIAQPGRSRLRQDRVVLPTSRHPHSPRPQHLAAAPHHSLSSLPPSGIQIAVSPGVVLPPEGFFPSAGLPAAPEVVVVCDLPSCLVTHTSQCHPVLQTPLPLPLPSGPLPLPAPPHLLAAGGLTCRSTLCTTHTVCRGGVVRQHDAGTSPPSASSLASSSPRCSCVSFLLFRVK